MIVLFIFLLLSARENHDTPRAAGAAVARRQNPYDAVISLLAIRGTERWHTPRIATPPLSFIV
jgi:hypothetical protein